MAGTVNVEGSDSESEAGPTVEVKRDEEDVDPNLAAKLAAEEAGDDEIEETSKEEED